MIVMLVVLIGLLVPALVVLAFAAYPRQGHRLPQRFDPYPHVEAATERFKPAAERFRPMAERMVTAAERSRPAVHRMREAVENTDSRLRRLVGESDQRRTGPRVAPLPVEPRRAAKKAATPMSPVPAAPAKRPREPVTPLPPAPHQASKAPARKGTRVTAKW